MVYHMLQHNDSVHRFGAGSDMQLSPHSATGVDCGGGFCASGYDRTEDNIEPIMHYCEEACTRCLAAEQDTKRKARPLVKLSRHMGRLLPTCGLSSASDAGHGTSLNMSASLSSEETSRILSSKKNILCD